MQARYIRIILCMMPAALLGSGAAGAADYVAMSGKELSRAALGDPDAERATRTVTVRLADYVWLLQRPATTAAPGSDPVNNSAAKPTNEKAQDRR